MYIKNIRIIAISIVLLCLALMPISVAAASGTRIVGTYTSDENISVYVCNVSADTTADIQLGTSQPEKVEVRDINDLPVSMQTLVMLDNSISIKEADRSKIYDLLQNLISDRKNKEEVAIATFSEHITYICDFTSEYSELKTAIDNISYEDQETYLTDVLYELITDDLTQRDDVCRRIIIISDGVDNKTLGITREELNDLLKENIIPISTVGCKNKKATNNEELEALFSISRQTQGVPVLLDDYSNMLDAASLLNEDKDIVRYLITPDASQLDGSLKTVKISVGENTVSVDCRMPQKLKADTEQVEEEPKTEIDKEEQETPEVVQEDIPDQDSVLGIPRNVFIIILGFIALILVILIIVLVRAAKKKKRFIPTEDFSYVETDSKKQDDEKTEFINSAHSESDGNTQLIWNNSQTYHIILTDINSPARTFRIPLDDTVVLGRKQDKCNVAFDYEKSVSSKHCEISVRDGHFYLKDLGSANGTYINDSQILDEVEIFSGNVIKMGRLEIRFEVR